MTTLIKANLKISNGQMNIDKYRVSAHKILLNIKSEQNLIYYVRQQKAVKMKRTDFLFRHVELPRFLYLTLQYQIKS